MSFVLTRFKERIIIDKPFAESLANELRSSQRIDGTILLLANEILLDPSYVFNYNSTDVNFPGRYHLILVADRFNSQGGKIDLTGKTGSTGNPDPGDPGTTPDAGMGDEHGAPGGVGGRGGDGGAGDPGMNIKIFVNEVVNIEIISNGGVGGEGGDGGRGGNGGAPGPAAGPAGQQGDAGKGGPGGKAGDGGRGGKIQVLFCNKPNGFKITDHLTSRGGIPGIRGNGGPPGSGNPPHLSGDQGLPGILGANLNPDVDEVNSRELWEKVIIELAIPSG